MNSHHPLFKIDYSFSLYSNACYNTRQNSHYFEFSKNFATTCLQKYQSELAILLLYECISRVSGGTAELEVESTPDEVELRIAIALASIYTNKKKWSRLASLHSHLLELSIENKCPMTKTIGRACELGEALEACGSLSDAALVYAEAAEYLQDAKHPSTAEFM